LLHEPAMRRRPAVRTAPLVLAAALLTAVPAAFGEQTYVTRFDAFTGYTFLNSPQISLMEHGFHFQAGVRPSTRYSIGFDYSISAGDLQLTPDLLPDNLQQSLNSKIAGAKALGVLPAGYQLVVPAHSRTQTFTIGPQLAFRHWAAVTLFLRPSIGAIYETATPQVAAADAFATGVVSSFKALGILPVSGTKTDWTYFYGVGGGIDFNFSRHVSWRVQADLVRDHLFNDVLKNSRGTVRFSVGPCFNFGKNIVE
jgi:hypothetical protein